MITTQQHEILNSAIEIYGVDSQIEMAIEEFLELALSLQKLKRKGNFKDKMISVCDEMADAKIMMLQLDKVFNTYEETISERINYKIDRLQERIKENNVTD